MPNYGYWVDISNLQLADNDDEEPTWIQAAPKGKYEHPFFGDIDINDDKIKNFADSVNKKFRDTDVDIDYDHKMYRGDAAGWVQAAEARKDGLYLQVKWTSEARQKLKEKAYKYFSPEYADEWKHPKTGKVFKDVVFGGALTNRPFLKGIAAINMSEVFDNASKHSEGVGMDPKEIRRLLKLSEDATDEEVTAKIEELQKDDDPGNDDGGAGNDDNNDDDDDDPENEDAPDVSQLSEQFPGLKKFFEEHEQMKVALQLSEANARVTKLGEVAHASKRSVPPAIAKELSEIAVKAPKALSDKLFSALEHLAKTGFVELGETGGSSNSQDGTDKDGALQFNEAVSKLMGSQKELTYSDAVTEVARTNPELFEAYRASSYSD